MAQALPLCPASAWVHREKRSPPGESRATRRGPCPPGAFANSGGGRANPSARPKHWGPHSQRHSPRPPCRLSFASS